jgi:leader peptidase (prepilin peptidase)/N-methyltransferase
LGYQGKRDPIIGKEPAIQVFLTMLKGKTVDGAGIVRHSGIFNAVLQSGYLQIVIPWTDLIGCVAFALAGSLCSRTRLLRRHRHRRNWIDANHAIMIAGPVLSFLIACLVATDPMQRVALGGLGMTLLALALIDTHYLILPDGLVGIVALLGLATAWLRPLSYAGMVDAIMAAALFGGGFLACRAVHRAVRGIEGMGLGDVKLAAAGGLWVGVQGIAPALLIATGTTLVTILLLGTAGNRRVPFGPGLALGIYAATLGSVSP